MGLNKDEKAWLIESQKQFIILQKAIFNEQSKAWNLAMEGLTEKFKEFDRRFERIEHSTLSWKIKHAWKGFTSWVKDRNSSKATRSISMVGSTQ